MHSCLLRYRLFAADGIINVANLAKYNVYILLLLCINTGPHRDLNELTDCTIQLSSHCSYEKY